jgi:hypothetical protein
MSATRADEALLLLEDGTLFVGRAVSPGTRFGEVVFNTAMTGYQEILSDPSYRGQIVVMTQPHIGNYGVDSHVSESMRPWVEGFVARRFTREPSNQTSEEGLTGYLGRHAIPALDGIDTGLSRLRERGALRGVVTTERSDIAGMLAELADFPTMTGRALVSEVTRKEATTLPAAGGGAPRVRLAVLDFGCKANILRALQSHGAELELLPAATTAAQVRALGVDGVVLSNGPGDPNRWSRSSRRCAARGQPPTQHLPGPSASRSGVRRPPSSSFATTAAINQWSICLAPGGDHQSEPRLRRRSARCPPAAARPGQPQRQHPRSFAVDGRSSRSVSPEARPVARRQPALPRFLHSRSRRTPARGESRATGGASRRGWR